MRYFFSMALTWAQWIVGIVPKSARTPAILFRVVHYAAVVLITVLLAVFSPRILGFIGGLFGKELTPDRHSEFINNHWCGVVFLLGYVLVRLLVYLITLLRVEDEVEFPDITRAWQKALLMLEDQGLDCRWLPLFVVNGLTAEQERNFFQASRSRWKIVAPPLEEPAPVRFFVNDDALFISCSGVGVMSRQMKNTGAEMPAPSGGRVLNALTPGEGAASGEAFGGTLAPGALPVGSMTLAPAGRLGTLRRIGGALGTLRALLPGGEGATLRTATAAGQSLVKLSPRETDRCRRRVRYVCDLLMRERTPYCAINGFIQVLPLEWTDGSHDLEMLTGSAAADMSVLHDSLGMRFPISVFLPGLDRCEGFSDLMERCAKIDPRFRDSRAGSRFPAGAPINNESCEWVVDHGLLWLKGWVYEGFNRDLDSPSNRALFYLLCMLRHRQRRLKSQLANSFKFGSHSADREEPPRLSGWYLGAVGEGAGRQGFVAHVLQKLVQEQNEVAWTSRTVRRDRLALAAAGVAFAAAIGLAAYDVLLAVPLVKGTPSAQAGDAPTAR